MANTDRHEPDFNDEPQHDDQQTPQSLSRDLEDLQSGLRVDFDQKLNELADMLARFKALVVSPSGTAANEETIEVKDIPLDQAAGESDETTDAQPKQSETTSSTDYSIAVDTARFENGLYKLNSQLYRFRLELDQELEFREEPLHIHFRQPSELSLLLQKISDRSSEKHPDN